MADITAANATFIISVPILSLAAQALQEFGADDIFDTEDVQPTEIMMSVDGFLSGGFVFVAKPMTITLMAGSASNSFFDAWNSGQQSGLLAAPATGVVTLTGLGSSYLLTNGFLTRFKPIADAKKMLQPRKYQVTWGNISPNPVGAAG
jgi:hypothetical protein